MAARRRPSRPAAPVLAALAVAAAGIALAAVDGGYAASQWTPLAVVCLVALLALGITGRGPGAAGRSAARRTALVALAVFAAWSLASVAWADDRSAALEGGGRAAFYAIVVALVLIPWPRAAARTALAVVVGATAVVALVTLVMANGAGADELFVEGRLSEPLGYAPATSNLWLVAFFPALGLAVDDRLGLAARALAVGAGGLFLQLALLSQSRGAVITFGFVVLLLVALHPRRGPVLAALAGVLALTAVNGGVLLDVRDARSLTSLGDTAGQASTAILVGSAGLALAAAAVLAGLGRLPRRRRTLLGGPRTGDRAALALLAAGTLGFLAVAGNPVSWTSDRWEDFKTSGYTEVEAGRSRLGGSLGSNRYDFYRVATLEFSRHPLLGIGADNFQIPYLQERRSAEAPVHPHSLPLGVLAQGGVPGVAAFLAFLGALGLATWRGLRGLGAGRASAVAALCGGLAWLVHASLDWLWAFPALTLPALLLLAVAAGAEDEAAGVARQAEADAVAATVERDAWGRPLPPAAVAAPAPADGEAATAAPALPARPATAQRPRAAAGPSLLQAAALLPLAAVLATLFAGLGLASRLERRGEARAATDPLQSRADFAGAADHDPFAWSPLVSQAILARRAGAVAEARGALDEAIDRAPEAWFPHFERGLLAALEGDRARTVAELSRARALNPGQPVVVRADELAAAGGRIVPDALEGELAGQQRARLEPTG